MSALEVVEVGLMYADGFLKLLDVFCAALAERSLCLSISLFALF